MKIQLGCDPEIFVADLQGNLKSIIGKIGGTKVNPLPLPIGEGYAVQEDNVAMEFNIPPATNADEYVKFIGGAMDFLSKVVHDYHQLQIVNCSAASFPDEELTDPRALEFGCDPDYNAYTGKKNPRPRASDKNLRSCGGHVHVGFDRSKASGEAVIRMMDLHLGVPSVLMDQGDLRKQLYGKAGAYREKVYGVEYRTLSNFWIFKPELIKWVWDSTSRAVNAAEAQFQMDDDTQKAIQSAINGNDKALAQALVSQYNLEVI